jgi:hypothetical protein
VRGFDGECGDPFCGMNHTASRRTPGIR